MRKVENISSDAPQSFAALLRKKRSHRFPIAGPVILGGGGTGVSGKVPVVGEETVSGDLRAGEGQRSEIRAFSFQVASAFNGGRIGLTRLRRVVARLRINDGPGPRVSTRVMTSKRPRQHYNYVYETTSLRRRLHMESVAATTFTLSSSPASRIADEKKKCGTGIIFEEIPLDLSHFYSPGTSWPILSSIKYATKPSRRAHDHSGSHKQDEDSTWSLSSLP